MIVKNVLRFLDAVDTLYKVQLRHRQILVLIIIELLHDIVYFMMYV